MTYSTTFGRAIAALLVGALVGGNLSMGLLIAGFGPPAEGEALQIWMVMQIYWMGGIVIFALIPFVLFHFSHLRQWYAMTALGTLTMLSISLYALKGVGTGGGLWVLATTGGLVGWVIWRVAYRRAETLGENE